MGKYSFPAGDPRQEEVEELPAKDSPQITLTVPGQPSHFASGVLGHSIA